MAVAADAPGHWGDAPGRSKASRPLVRPSPTRREADSLGVAPRGPTPVQNGAPCRRSTPRVDRWPWTPGGGRGAGARGPGAKWTRVSILPAAPPLGPPVSGRSSRRPYRWPATRLSSNPCHIYGAM